MFKNDFAMALIAHGNVLEEHERKVRMPFGEEYKVRLINKHSKRAGADLLINGDKIARFVLSGGETIDIERYIDGNNNSGSKFKFVSLNSSEVIDKESIENGLIEVLFYPEKEPPIVKEIHHYHDNPWDSWPVPKPGPWPYPDKPYWDKISHPMVFGASTSRGMSCSHNVSLGSELNGSTVRGKESEQKFQDVCGLEWESHATILKLMIVNGELNKASRYCSGCARKRKQGEKHCSNCGNKY